MVHYGLFDLFLFLSFLILENFLLVHILVNANEMFMMLMTCLST